MGSKAAAVYVRHLIALQGRTEASVCQQAGVYGNYLWRWESGAIQMPGADTVATFTRLVDGSAEDVFDLLLSASDTSDEPRRRAEVRHHNVMTMTAPVELLNPTEAWSRELEERLAQEIAEQDREEARAILRTAVDTVLGLLQVRRPGASASAGRPSVPQNGPGG